MSFFLFLLLFLSFSLEKEMSKACEGKKFDIKSLVIVAVVVAFGYRISQQHIFSNMIELSDVLHSTTVSEVYLLFAT